MTDLIIQSELRNIRAKLNLTQAEMARAYGMQRRNYIYYESGARMLLAKTAYTMTKRLDDYLKSEKASKYD